MLYLQAILDIQVSLNSCIYTKACHSDEIKQGAKLEKHKILLDFSSS